MHVGEVPKSGDITTPALVFFREGSIEDDTSAVAISIIGAGTDVNSSYFHSRSLIESLFEHLERPNAVNYSHVDDKYFIEKFPHFHHAMSNSHWRASCGPIVVRNQRRIDEGKAGTTAT